MNILLVHPMYPDTYWSFKHALKFISKKAVVPPLGLITVSSLLPPSWQKRLIDLNIESLKDRDLDWADYVFISAMYVQKDSVNTIIEKCKKRKVKIVAGGPLFTQDFSNYPQIDHLILNEAELTMPQFLADIESGITPHKIYRSGEYADMKKSPVPDYSLVLMKKYAFMNLQVTRGCPFSCDFCEITSLLGHKVRMKETFQVLEELDELYKLNWRGGISIVDDNFIGNQKEIKSNLLPAINNWMKEHNYPFTFSTQTSINLADDDELLSMMVESGFNSTFIGIETPDDDSLNACNKVQNKNRDMLQSIHKIQSSGMIVSGGFIVGFDSDTTSIFKNQIEFIQRSGIVTAMVGLLNAPKNTKLYKRLEKEKRIAKDATGDNTDMTMNFTPKMNNKTLLSGYNDIINGIYSVRPYYKRIRKFLTNYTPHNQHNKTIELSHIGAILRSIIIIGIINNGRHEFWKFLLWTLFKRPGMFVDAITFTVYGYHFRKIFELKKRATLV